MTKEALDIEKKRQKEKDVVDVMIKMYCKGKKHEKEDGQELCPDCSELSKYVDKRIELCPFMEEKTFCNNCKVHCYNKTMRQKIKDVMRYSGPFMLFRHPLLTINHAIESYKDKKKLKMESR